MDMSNSGGPTVPPLRAPPRIVFSSNKLYFNFPFFVSPIQGEKINRFFFVIQKKTRKIADHPRASSTLGGEKI